MSTWNHLAEDAMATNNDPVVGGIIDKQIVSGKWFVIPNNDAIPQAEDFASKADAFAYLNSKIAELTPQERQFHVVLSYSTALDSPKEAIELALSVAADRSGVYVEVFEADKETTVLEGECDILNQVAYPKDVESKYQPITADVPEGSFDNFNVVISFSTLAATPQEALGLALSAVDNYNGGYIEVFADGHKGSIFEAELGELYDRSQAPRI